MKAPKPLIIDARTEAGVLHIEKRLRRQMGAAIKGWPDGPVEVELRPWLATRSMRAHRYLFGVVYKLMAVDSGYTIDQLHELMKLRHNYELIADPSTGEEVRIAKTTTTLKVEDFGQFIELVMLDGAEWFGMVFPEPRRSEDWREGKAA